MKITSDFPGGNIKIVAIKNGTIRLDSDMRDSSGDWFYWAFGVEGADGETLHFSFPKNRVGYYGPAVSHDLLKWEWLGQKDGEEEFSYTFGEGEGTVYFAHHILYPESRIAELAQKYNFIKISTLTQGRLGSNVPLLQLGSGDKKLLLTARHHACESTGSYVLEGVLQGLAENPISDVEVLAVPFVDYDGYLSGDQGKSRQPHDHNRDYDPALPSLYPETDAIKKLAREVGVDYAFDFHSPYHKGEEHDLCFIVQKANVEELRRFAAILESQITDGAFRYQAKNDLAPGVKWNNPASHTFANYMAKEVGAKIACTLETAYFGESDNVASADKFIELGRCFAAALKKYIEE